MDASLNAALQSEQSADAVLDGHVIILTGASSGLGAEMARAIRGAGAEVVLGARRTDRLSALAEETGATAVPCDVTRADDRQRLVTTALEQHGRIDGLVNNAGIASGKRALVESDEEFAATITTNLIAPFALARLVGAEMRTSGGGSIVNTASVMGIRSVPNMPDAGYVASKAGLVGLTRELACQWGRYGIRVNALAPGVFPSEMTGHLFETENGTPEWLQQATPLGRSGHAGDLDAALVFLLSSGASFVTGHVLVIDGGLTTH